MALMPKRVKHRKSQRGRIKGNATRGNRVVFGEFGLQAMQGGWIKAQTIEAGRIAAQQYVRGEGRLYVRMFPHRSITSTPLETRMGKGKGEPEHWVATVRPGTVLYELGGVTEDAGTRLLCASGSQDADPRAIRAAPADVVNRPDGDDSCRKGTSMNTKELRDMSDEQLAADAPRNGGTLVSVANAGPDRTTGRAQRIAAQSPPGRPHQDAAART